MKNHAFIIPAHKQPQLLHRILKNLEFPNHYFFIHVNKKVKDISAFVNALQDVKNVEFVERICIYHGTISQVYATIKLLKATDKHPVHFHYIHQISGQDYPLRSNQQFDEYFEGTNDSFMCYAHETNLEEVQKSRLCRTSGYYPNIQLDGLIGKYIRYFCKIVGNNNVVKFVFPRTQIDNLSNGWDWFSWSDKVLDYVLCQINKTDNEGYQLLERFSHTLSPSEMYFQTLLKPHLETLHIRKHFPLRYVSWQPHRPISTNYRPFNLNELDYDFILKTPAFFCRKVDEIESAKLLDLIDKQRGTYFNVDDYADFDYEHD